jgi:hypothetical protein
MKQTSQNNKNILNLKKKTHLIPTFHSVVLYVHVIQTKVEFVSLQLLQALILKLQLYRYLLEPQNATCNFRSG